MHICILMRSKMKKDLKRFCCPFTLTKFLAGDCCSPTLPLCISQCILIQNNTNTGENWAIANPCHTNKMHEYQSTRNIMLGRIRHRCWKSGLLFTALVMIVATYVIAYLVLNRHNLHLDRKEGGGADIKMLTNKEINEFFQLNFGNDYDISTSKSIILMDAHINLSKETEFLKIPDSIGKIKF